MTTKPQRSKCRTIRPAPILAGECLGVMGRQLCATEAEGECDAISEIARLGRRELVIGHPHRLEQTGNEGKNAGQGKG